MSVPTFPPPAPEAIALLRQKPSYQQEAAQHIIDRFATGEIGSEETVLLLQQAALNQVTQAQLLRGLQHETGDTGIEQQAAAREQQAREMLQNQNNELPTIIDEDEESDETPASPVGVPGRVISSGGAVDVSIPSAPTTPAAAGLGGASGSWGSPAAASVASVPAAVVAGSMAGAIVVGAAGAIVVDSPAESPSNPDGFDDQDPANYENYGEEDPTDFED